MATPAIVKTTWNVDVKALGKLNTLSNIRRVAQSWEVWGSGRICGLEGKGDVGTHSIWRILFQHLLGQGTRLQGFKKPWLKLTPWSQGLGKGHAPPTILNKAEQNALLRAPTETMGILFWPHRPGRL